MNFKQKVGYTARGAAISIYAGRVEMSDKD